MGACLKAVLREGDSPADEDGLVHWPGLELEVEVPAVSMRHQLTSRGQGTSNRQQQEPPTRATSRSHQRKNQRVMYQAVVIAALEKHSSITAMAPLAAIDSAIFAGWD